MTRTEFKTRWESSEDGGGILFDDVAEAYTAWGLGRAPRTQRMDVVRYAVLKAAGIEAAEEFAPEEEEEET